MSLSVSVVSRTLSYFEYAEDLKKEREGPAARTPTPRMSHPATRAPATPRGWRWGLPDVARHVIGSQVTNDKRVQTRGLHSSAFSST